MKYRIRIVVMLLAVVFLVPDGQVGRAFSEVSRIEPLSSAPTQPASVTDPGSAVVVANAGSLNSRGWPAGTSSGSLTGSTNIAQDVLAAYNLAVASAPAGCHLPVSLLAAIGQVESGNLAGHRLDAGHRVVPAILGPVLDGDPFQAVPDTDAGQWDGNAVWDRALGPLQLIPASWRVVGVDMDGDGQRDPQDVDDAAGAAMVYLCAGGRDLGTDAGLREAVLSYNHSTAYLDTVLAWKTQFDAAGLGGLGSLPMFDATALPSISAGTPVGTVHPAVTGRPVTAAGAPGPLSTPSTSSTPVPSTVPSTGPTPGPSLGPSLLGPPAGSTDVPSSAPSPAPPSTPSSPPTQPTGPDPKPTPDLGPDPGPGPGPDPAPGPGPVPFCALPLLPGATEALDPAALVAAGTAVAGTPGLDEQGNACLHLVDPVTGQLLFSYGTGPGASQTQSAGPGAP